MVKKSVREAIFFLLVYLLFFLGAKVIEYWSKQGKMRADFIYIIVGVIYTLVILGVFYLAKLQDGTKENFWDVSPGAKCRGGLFFAQGDSEEATQCRELASTPEGRCEIASYTCPTGFIGTPNLPFIYTPVSGDDWTNERCEDKPTCTGCPYDSEVTMMGFNS